MPRYISDRFGTQYLSKLYGFKVPEWMAQYLHEGIAPGERNDGIFKIACVFKDNGKAFEFARNILAKRALDDGLSEAEAVKAINSAYSRPVAQAASAFTASAAPTVSATTPTPAASTATPPPGPPNGTLPVPIPDPLPAFLNAVFRPGEFVSMSQTIWHKDIKKWGPDGGVTHELEFLLSTLSQKSITTILPNLEGRGLFVRINPMTSRGTKDAQVTAYRHCLVESDTIPKLVQFQAAIDSGLPITAILDSGERSIHNLVCVNAPDLAEFTRRRDIVYAILAADPANKNPGHYSRLPGVDRKIFDEAGNLLRIARQELLAINIGAKSWEEWETAYNAAAPAGNGTAEGGVAAADAGPTGAELDVMAKEWIEYYLRGISDLPKPMAEEAFYGVAGEIVKLIAKDSEACREALLTQLLVALGNILGRNTRMKQAAWHFLNEYVVLVGKTSTGRKGSAWNALEDLFEIIDPNWYATRVLSGFQSGEGIVHEIRDSQVIAGKRKIFDPGVSDKRLLIFEEEFGRLLNIAGRQGNTISEIVRESWDSRKRLNTKGKIAPETATDPHVSMIGHITPTELLRLLRELENENGFSNRILWVAAYRAQILPTPGSIDWRNDQPAIVKQLNAVLQTFQFHRCELQWSTDGKAAWQAFHQSMKSLGGGSIGSILGRAIPHILRLSMIYAVLDNSTLVEAAHLTAAKAVWDYCMRTAKWIFKGSTGNKCADRIYWALKHEPKGMTQNEITNFVFSRNVPAMVIEQAFSLLLELELVTMIMERAPNTPKPIKRWFAKDQDVVFVTSS